MAAMVLAVTYSALARRLFGEPSGWVIAVSEYALLYLTFLGAAWVYRKNGHVSVDLFVSRLGEGARGLAHRVGAATAAIVSSVVFWYSLGVTLDLYERGSILRGSIDVPQFVIVAAIPFGALLLIAESVAQFFKGPPEAPDEAPVV